MRRIQLLLAVAILAPAIGCSLSFKPSAADTAIASGGDGQIYDGQLLGFTIADVETLAADLGLECTKEQPYGDDIGFFCRTSTPESDTPEWFIIQGHVFGDEAYNLTILTSTAPPNEHASRDAAADIAETLMPWIADLGWYRSGDFECRAGRQGDREFDNFGPDYSICASSSSDPGGDGTRSGAELDIATEP